MKKIVFEDGRFVFYDDQERMVLLDSCNVAANKSRLPMRALDDSLTIPRLLMKLAEEHEKIREGTEEEVFPAYLLDILMTSYLIRTSAPLRVLEIGAVSGVLSYHLAALMGRLNRDSFLCGVSDIIGNDSENHWLDRISMVEQPPNLSMVVSDYENTHLEGNHFDIVVINGTVLFDKPYETIREAERLVKQGGILLCHTANAPLLESCFKLIYSERQEYEISPLDKILVTEYRGNSWGVEKDILLESEVTELCRKLQESIEQGRNPEEIRPFADWIDKCVDKAVKTYDIARKVELIRLKEQVLDYMLNAGKESGKYYKNKCLETLTSYT